MNTHKSFLDFIAHNPQHVAEGCGCDKKKSVPDSEDIETSEVDKLDTASTEDKAEYPGKRGETAHHTLHKTLDTFIQKMRSMGHK